MADERDIQELTGSSNDAVNETVLTALKNVHTALPGIIESFDAVKQSARVRPAIKRIFTQQGPLDLPLCVDCPVAFPQGGGFCFTFPLQEGDEVVLGFFERAIDRWYVEGGTQPPAVFRLHDLSDGFCIPGVSNLTRSIPNFKADAVQMRNREGTAYVQINSSGEVEIDGSKLTIKCPVIAEDTSRFEGLVTYTAGMTGSGGVGQSFTINGNIAFSGGTLTHNGKNIGSTHIHSNGNGGANTGGPV